MVHHIVLFKLKPDVTPAKLETMMTSTRMTLLKIPEVLNIKCGKRVAPTNDWPFFIAIDFESMDRLATYQEDPLQMKFVTDILQPNTSECLTLDYEMEPGKDVTYS